MNFHKYKSFLSAPTESQTLTRTIKKGTCIYIPRLLHNICHADRCVHRNLSIMSQAANLHFPAFRQQTKARCSNACDRNSTATHVSTPHKSKTYCGVNIGFWSITRLKMENLSQLIGSSSTPFLYRDANNPVGSGLQNSRYLGDRRDSSASIQDL